MATGFETRVPGQFQGSFETARTGRNHHTRFFRASLVEHPLAEAPLDHRVDRRALLLDERLDPRVHSSTLRLTAMENSGSTPSSLGRCVAFSLTPAPLVSTVAVSHLSPLGDCAEGPLVTPEP